MTNKNFNKKKGGRLIPLILILAGVLLFAYDSLISIVGKTELDVKIEHAPAILPAAYKVYANEHALDGKYHIFKMLITNTGNSTIKNLKVDYDIPAYIEKTNIRNIAILKPGQSAVVSCFPNFNPNIVEKTTASKERVNIEISGIGLETVEESFPIEIKGRNELMYTFIPFDEIRTPGEFFDNLQLASCFVTPEDPIVKYYTQKIQEKVLKGEAASVYNTEEEGIRFLTGIYDATLASHMVYSGTSGVPSNESGISSITQSIRLPRELITGNTGLCIELSILYASVLMNAGLDPIIFLIPGHAYPGFKMNGNFYAIEATGIGGEGLNSIESASQAFQTGMKQLEEFKMGIQSGDDRYSIIDVREYIRKGALAMELKDDPYLRSRIDEIAKNFETQAKNHNPYYATNPSGAGEHNTTLAGYINYNGSVSFSYPGNWLNVPRNPGTIPYNVITKASPLNEAYLEVYEFQGFNNPEQAILSIQQHIQSKGAMMQYAITGQEQGFTLFNGQTFGGYEILTWIAAFKPVHGGVAGIAVGMSSNAQNNYENEISNILNSLR